MRTNIYYNKGLGDILMLFSHLDSLCKDNIEKDKRKGFGLKCSFWDRLHCIHYHTVPIYLKRCVGDCIKLANKNVINNKGVHEN